MKLILMKKLIVFISIVFSIAYSEIVYRVPIEGVIDLGLPPYIKRVIKALIAQNKTSMPVGLDIEIIPRKTFLEFRVADIQNDLLNFQNSALK